MVRSDPQEPPTAYRSMQDVVRANTLTTGQRWFLTGYRAGDLAGCDTFSVPSV